MWLRLCVWMLSSLCLNLSFQPRFCSPVSECIAGFFWHCLTPWTLNRQWQEPQKYKPRQSSRPLFLQYYMHYWNIYWTVLRGIYKTWMWGKETLPSAPRHLSNANLPVALNSIWFVLVAWNPTEKSLEYKMCDFTLGSCWNWIQLDNTNTLRATSEYAFNWSEVCNRYPHSVQKWMQVLLEERAAVLHWELQGQNPWSADKHESKYKTSHINLLSKCLSSRRR